MIVPVALEPTRVDERHVAAARGGGSFLDPVARHISLVEQGHLVPLGGTRGVRGDDVLLVQRKAASAGGREVAALCHGATSTRAVYGESV